MLNDINDLTKTSGEMWTYIDTDKDNNTTQVRTIREARDHQDREGKDTGNEVRGKKN